ncbi:disease resistance protein, partial [Trifolium medium]|nr:disease resistance protein [Trifolium medium]
DEAWSLFQEMAGDVVNKPDIYPIAREVANECAGLPLAIVTIGRALDNEEKIVWEDALQQLRNSQSSSFLDMQEFYCVMELAWGCLRQLIMFGKQEII